MVLVYTFNQQITASENIPPQRREVLIGGNGIVFTHTEPLLFGIKYTMRNICLMHVMAVQIHIKIFELPLFSWDSLEDLIRNSKITGARAETVDIFPVVHLYIFIVAEETVQLTNDFSTNKQLKC